MTCRGTRNPKSQSAVSKERILTAIAELPDDATIEDAMECLHDLFKRENPTGHSNYFLSNRCDSDAGE